MKARSARVMAGGDQMIPSSRNKTETLGVNGGTINQQASAAQARKRRSSINVYDQPSSLNSRLRQLETDMLRLDEDRTKLFDDTHSTLAQYELKLGEIHAILKSRQDNVEKYVGDMKLLLQAKEEFEKQTKLLNDKHDRIHEKFTHRETIIAREIKLLKNKFEILEKNRQFRGMLQKSSQSASGGDSLGGVGVGSFNDELSSGLENSSELQARGSLARRSETTTIHTSDLEASTTGLGARLSSSAVTGSGLKGVRVRISKFMGLGQLLAPLFETRHRRRRRRRQQQTSETAQILRKSNKVSAMEELGDDPMVRTVGMAAQDGPVQEASAEVASYVESSHGGEGVKTDGLTQLSAIPYQTLAVEAGGSLKAISLAPKRGGGGFLTRLFARTTADHNSDGY